MLLVAVPALDLDGDREEAAGASAGPVDDRGFVVCGCGVVGVSQRDLGIVLYFKVGCAGSRKGDGDTGCLDERISVGVLHLVIDGIAAAVRNDETGRLGDDARRPREHDRDLQLN